MQLMGLPPPAPIHVSHLVNQPANHYPSCLPISAGAHFADHPREFSRWDHYLSQVGNKPGNVSPLSNTVCSNLTDYQANPRHTDFYPAASNQPAPLPANQLYSYTASTTRDHSRSHWDGHQDNPHLDHSLSLAASHQDDLQNNHTSVYQGSGPLSPPAGQLSNHPDTSCYSHYSNYLFRHSPGYTASPRAIPQTNPHKYLPSGQCSGCLLNQLDKPHQSTRIARDRSNPQHNFPISSFGSYLDNNSHSQGQSPRHTAARAPSHNRLVSYLHSYSYVPHPNSRRDPPLSLSASLPDNRPAISCRQYHSNRPFCRSTRTAISISCPPATPQTNTGTSQSSNCLPNHREKLHLSTRLANPRTDFQHNYLTSQSKSYPNEHPHSHGQCFRHTDNKLISPAHCKCPINPDHEHYAVSTDNHPSNHPVNPVHSHQEYSRLKLGHSPLTNQQIDRRQNYVCSQAFTQLAEQPAHQVHSHSASPPHTHPNSQHDNHQENSHLNHSISPAVSHRTNRQNMLTPGHSDYRRCNNLENSPA